MWWTVHLEGGPRRVNHAAVAVGNMILSFGGYCTGDNYKNKTPIDLFVLNPHTYRWKEVPKPRTDSAEAEDWPYQRYGHTVCSHNTDVYLFGGRNDESPCNAVYKFDTRTGTWSRPSVSGTVPPERDGHSACIIRDAMYVFGGYEESHSRYGQEVFMLDLTTMVRSLAATNGEQPIYRDFHSATAVGDKMFIFGGRSEMPGERENYSNKLSYLVRREISVFSTKTVCQRKFFRL
jgi:N-acetylneuraminic acid mutarotase